MEAIDAAVLTVEESGEGFIVWEGQGESGESGCDSVKRDKGGKAFLGTGAGLQSKGLGRAGMKHTEKTQCLASIACRWRKVAVFLLLREFSGRQ